MHAPSIPGLQDYPDLLKAYEMEFSVRSRGCGCSAGGVLRKYGDLVAQRKADEARYSLANRRPIR